MRLTARGREHHLPLPFAVVGALRFVALIMAAILTGGLSGTKLPGEYGTLPKTPAKEKGHWVRAAELTAEGFGTMASKIGIVVALAAIIGVCLVESGAAEKVVRRVGFGLRGKHSRRRVRRFLTDLPAL